jgi:hypothetical protein
MICRDTFTKFAGVVPIKNKQDYDIAAGVSECMYKMGKKPEIIYTDDEGALHKPSIQTHAKTKNIQSLSIAHAIVRGSQKDVLELLN